MDKEGFKQISDTKWVRTAGTGTRATDEIPDEQRVRHFYEQLAERGKKKHASR